MKSHLLSCTNILHFIRNMHRKAVFRTVSGYADNRSMWFFGEPGEGYLQKITFFNTFYHIAKPTIAQSKTLLAYPSKRLKTAAELCPPKPNVLLNATFTSLSWASLKVRLIRLSISGSSLK